jgi:hypothetical protein
MDFVEIRTVCIVHVPSVFQVRIPNVSVNCDGSSSSAYKAYFLVSQLCTANSSHKRSKRFTLNQSVDFSLGLSLHSCILMADRLATRG